MGPQERIEVKQICKTPGTTLVPGVKLSANKRPVFGHMTPIYDIKNVVGIPQGSYPESLVSVSLLLAKIYGSQ